ncbi:MAG TPA: hypothetical protein VN157_14585, partial [Caulobacter sp.]|nr:hypothetical protein [Caulobacter sp.]
MKVVALLMVARTWSLDGATPWARAFSGPLDRFDQENDVETFGRKRATDERVGRLAGLDAGKGSFDRRDAGRFLAHEGARRTGDLVHDRDVAGEQVRKLGEEQRRAQFGRQLFIEEL